MPLVTEEQQKRKRVLWPVWLVGSTLALLLVLLAVPWWWPVDASIGDHHLKVWAARPYPPMGGYWSGPDWRMWAWRVGPRLYVVAYKGPLAR